MTTPAPDTPHSFTAGTETIAPEAAPEKTPEGVEIVSRRVYPNGTVIEQLGKTDA